MSVAVQDSPSSYKLQVLKILRSPLNPTAAIVPVHYSHDPAKDSEWLQQEKVKYQREHYDWEKVWAREMEMDFTAVAGAPAYPGFSDNNLIKNLEYHPSLPLRLCLDFNVEPMIWIVAQVLKGTVYCIDEIYQAPADIPGMVREFRNRYPAHTAEVWIYGDASGRARNPQTAQSDYDLVRLAFRGYPSPVIFNVPLTNPPVKDRINALNLRLKGIDGQPGIFIDPTKCPELVKDLREVVVSQDGSQIVKSKKRDDPYYYRTHASDALGYLIWREWPVVKEVIQVAAKPRGPRRYGRVLGQLR